MHTTRFWNNLHRIRFNAHDAFLESPSSDTLQCTRRVSGIAFVGYAQTQCYVFTTGVSDRKSLYRLAFYSTLIKNAHDTVYK
jgi:hypothetical protein